MLRAAVDAVVASVYIYICIYVYIHTYIISLVSTLAQKACSPCSSHRHIYVWGVRLRLAGFSAGCRHLDTAGQPEILFMFVRLCSHSPVVRKFVSPFSTG